MLMVAVFIHITSIFLWSQLVSLLRVVWGWVQCVLSGRWLMWCLGFGTDRLVHSWLGSENFTWQSSHSCSYPCCWCTFSYHSIKLGDRASAYTGWFSLDLLWPILLVKVLMTSGDVPSLPRNCVANWQSERPFITFAGALCYATGFQ